MFKEQSFIDSFIDKGLKRESISEAFSDVLHFYQRIETIEGRNLDLQREHLHVPHGRGSCTPEIMIVSDLATDQELKHGVVGVDPYSVYLMMFMHRLDIPMQDLYWTLAVKEHIHPKDLTMKKIKSHYNQLEAEIQTLKPSIIITFGTVAISSLANEPVKIQEAIGGEFYFHDVPVIPLKHPKDIIKLEEDKFKKETAKMWKELKKMQEYMKDW